MRLPDQLSIAVAGPAAWLPGRNHPFGWLADPGGCRIL